MISAEFWTWISVSVVFAVAGIAKGVIGFGLPTIAMGLLGLFVAPQQAAAALVVPSFITNVWQAAAGPALGRVARRLATMLVFVCIGVWIGFAVLPHGGSGARIALGAALALYALSGLCKIELKPAASRPYALGAAIGFTTGLITAATGVFVIPAVPYMQSLRFTKEELSQALGLSFTVSTVALAAGLAHQGALTAALGWQTLATVLAAVAGMSIGQRIRSRMSAEAFRKAFFWSLLVLGCAIVAEGARQAR